MNRGTLLIKGGKLLTSAGFMEGGALLIEEGQIVFAGTEGGIPEVPPEAEEVSLAGEYVVPGFIDVHIHGAAGADTMDGTYEALNTIASQVARYGTTGFLPSTVTAAPEALARVCKAVKKAAETGTKGAEVLGVHLEGPYINVKKKGAQNAEYVRRPDVDELSELCELSGDRVRLVSLAPEAEDALPAIQWLSEKGVTVSVGHSDATYDEVVRAVNCGLKHATHTFNGMLGLHHREPGTVGAIMAVEAINAEVIADLIHVHPAVIRLLVEAKGNDRIVLVTDAIRAMGMADGEYDLGGLRVIVQNGVARLPEGNLAGSTLTMEQAVKNMVEKVGVSLIEAIKMATINPARAVGLSHRKGSLQAGKDGDVVILTEELTVAGTIVGGRIVYRADQ